MHVLMNLTPVLCARAASFRKFCYLNCSQLDENQYLGADESCMLDVLVTAPGSRVDLDALWEWLNARPPQGTHLRKSCCADHFRIIACVLFPLKKRRPCSTKSNIRKKSLSKLLE